MRKQRWLRPLLALLLTLLVLPFLTGGSARGADHEGIIFLPIAANADEACDIQGTRYNTLPIASEPTDIPAECHPDTNLAVRGFSKTTADLDLVLYGGPTDTRAPQMWFPATRSTLRMSVWKRTS